MTPILIALAAIPQTQSAPGAILMDRNRVDRAAPLTAPRPAPLHPSTAASIKDAPGTPITGIRFVGAQAPAPVAKAARGFLGKRASRQTLAELAAALSAAYGGAPVALYTIAIPAQDFAHGVVTVRLTEGRIVRAVVRSKRPADHTLLRAHMARLTRETPLSRATFEREVTLIRAIPGLTVDTGFTDPDGTGALVMTATPKQRRSKLTAGFSNRGVDLLGSGMFDVKGELYGAAVDGDQLTLSASTASDFKRYRYIGGGYAAPIGSDGLTASVGAAYLETRPRHYPLTGRAKQINAALSYPLVRSFHRAADVSLGIDGLNSDNAAFGNVVASERSRAVRLAASYVEARTRRSVTLSGSLSKGLDIFGARVTAPLAQAGFLKATASASIDQAIGKRMVARITASGQYSGDRLPAAERFAVGGEAIGRAFDTGLLTGDRGAGALAEFAWRPIRRDRFATSEVYAFVDRGAVTVLDRVIVPEQHYTLASTGIGVRARYRDKAELGLEAARSIDDPYPNYGEDWRISVAWKLSV